MPSKSVLLAATLAACSKPPHPELPPPVAPVAVVAQPIVSSAETRVEQNLARLRALRVVYVGDLVVQPGETRAQAAEQLELFTEIAEAAVREPPATAPEVGSIHGYLTQLRGLEVVEIGDLIEQRPAQSGRCWGMCPEDRAVIVERADRLRRIAAAELAAHAHLVDETK